MARYKIKNLQKVASPTGTGNFNWYRFIIENDKNSITNLRSGSKKEVLNFAEESVKRLNEKYFTHVHFKTHKPVNENNMINYI